MKSEPSKDCVVRIEGYVGLSWARYNTYDTDIIQMLVVAAYAQVILNVGIVFAKRDTFCSDVCRVWPVVCISRAEIFLRSSSDLEISHT